VASAAAAVAAAMDVWWELADAAADEVSALHDALDDSGVPLLEFERVVEKVLAKTKRKKEKARREAGAIHEVVCTKCRQRPATFGLPTLGSASDASGSDSDEECAEEAVADADSAKPSRRRPLCYACAADTANEARAPSRKRHGQVEATGADGFDGWVSGLRRVNDPKALQV